MDLIAEAGADDSKKLEDYPILNDKVTVLAAIRLFKDYVTSGTLKPIVKHLSNMKAQIVYRLLYILSSAYGSERLSNLVIDELILFFEKTNLIPTSYYAEATIKCCDGEENVPSPLRTLLVDYIASQPTTVEEVLAQGGTSATGVPEWDNNLVLKWAQSLSSGTKIKGPEWSSRCQYHIHQHTIPCAEESAYRIASLVAR